MSARRRWIRWALPLYLLLLVASHLTQWFGGSAWTPPPDMIGEQVIDIPMPLASGSDPSRTMRLAYIERGTPTAGQPPIFLLHGSPGQAYDYDFQRDPSVPTFLDRLAANGRRAFAVDLPGFGNSQTWIPDYSSRAAARAMLSMMDELGIERAHFVCWSNSGAVGINLCDLAPERLASLTLMAGVGAQSTEGSGSYWFEHAKYLVGMPLVVGLPELIPHFGLLGSTGLRHAFIRSFLDNDQRPLAAIMAHTHVPTLILHGRHDFLIADWAAEEHHRLMPSSRLVMIDASHFLPFLQAEQSSQIILDHVRRHDAPNVAPLTDYENLAPRVARSGLSAWVEHVGVHVRHWPFWIVIAALLLLAWWKPETATLLAALFVAPGDVDFGVAFVALLAARLIRGLELPDQRRNWWWIVTQCLWTAVALSIGSAFVSLTDPAGRTLGGWTLLPLIVLGVLLLRLVRHIWTWTGRRRILAAVRRTLHHEWWPMWAFYLPIWCIMPVILLRHAGRLIFTCLNPGIENGGGFVGESKARILAGFADAGDAVLHARLIGHDDPDRVATALALIEADPDLGGYPIVLKPDTGQRGVGVALARSAEQVRAYIDAHPGTFILQRFHPGPCECGIFWMRHDPQTDPRPVHQRDGFIFSINGKLFQHLEGDGVHTVRQLIWRHPRYRCQARVFLDRFADRLDHVLPRDERLLLSFAGNHAQGTCFVDRADLITPELEREINRIARSFHDDGFDFGRFDLRYQSDELLRQGRGFAILEINGLTSESTNMYDPARSLPWAWSILVGQWKHAVRIGNERMAAGKRPVPIRRLLSMVAR